MLLTNLNKIWEKYDSDLLPLPLILPDLHDVRTLQEGLLLRCRGVQLLEVRVGGLGGDRLPRE